MVTPAPKPASRAPVPVQTLLASKLAEHQAQLLHAPLWKRALLGVQSKPETLSNLTTATPSAALPKALPTALPVGHHRVRLAGARFAVRRRSQCASQHGEGGAAAVVVNIAVAAMLKHGEPIEEASTLQSIEEARAREEEHERRRAEKAAMSPHEAQQAEALRRAQAEEQRQKREAFEATAAKEYDDSGSERLSAVLDEQDELFMQL